MRVLVIGKSKTGTTALVSLIKSALDPCALVMEPKSVLEFGVRSQDHTDNEAIKIVYEHFRGRWRHLDALVHGEFGFPVHKAVFILRDVRDEMISKLLYHAKVARVHGVVSDPAAFAEWVRVLETKERDPRSLSFHDLCIRFEQLFHDELWARITDMAERIRYESYLTQQVERDHLIVAYEDMVTGKLDGLAEYIGRSFAGGLPAIDLGPYQHTLRSGRAGNWRAVFTAADVDRLRPILRATLLGPLYDDWDLEPEPRLDPAEYSGYVRRISMDSDEPDPSQVAPSA